VSLADTRRAVAMYRKLNIPPLGLIENMSYFVCPDCGHESDIFGKGGGEQLAADMRLAFLGRIPLHEPVRTGGDRGVPIVVSDPASAPALALSEIAARIAQQVSIASFARKEIPLRVIS
jgi:ATP-binding protein involved in chromosome partitioning